MTTTSEYLGIGDVAELYGTTRSALYTQKYRNEAPGALCVRVGKRLVWRRADLEAWWEKQRREAEAG